MTSTREVLETAAAYIKEAIDQLPAGQPEVPDRVEVWLEDDKHLRGDFWRDREGDVWAYRNNEWRIFNPMTGALDYMIAESLDLWSPLTRTTDPSQPRRFDSLADIPEDMDRAVGKHVGLPCELARSPLSGTGWMMRVDHPYVRQQWVEYMDLGEDDLTDIKEVIDHE